ncbi:GSU2403 family nucleotidyltransferase fold protein [Micromonospora sp. WMMD729]|uniref:GSU2403 family nucleotidyltransferase fold protein n=1 Tax=Micromonospora sp. WMMD729 TaxID=3404127 RepID=UPI003BF4BA2F
MSELGDVDLLVAARSALLDALEALRHHADAVVVVGAQAVYLHTGAAPVALAEATKDCDLALDARVLPEEPLLEEAMRSAGFHLNVQAQQPGAWLNPKGIPVDLMVPEALAGGSGRRAVKIPPHARNAARRAVGLEAAVVDHVAIDIRALAPGDSRVYAANVAGPAALLVAKLHKIGERQETPKRLVDKDAHDIYRLLVAVRTERLAASLAKLRADDLAQQVTEQALVFLADLFPAGPEAPGSVMAGRAEQGIGDPPVVSAAAAALADDLLALVGRSLDTPATG